ncbi:MAG: gluconokinase [Pseudolysinimonas sp.]
MRSVVVMGVSGSGKTTVGIALAEALGMAFADGDDLHPPSNIAKMAAGTPLTDDDRWPWLDAVGAVLADGATVVACSALRRAHRDRLRLAAPDLRLVFLHGSRALLAERMGHRVHFMPIDLLDSQLATLEPPAPEERALEYDVTATVGEIVSDAAARLGGPEPAP